MTDPTTHLVDAIKDQKQEEVELFEIKLRGPPASYIYVNAGPEVTWQSKVFQTARFEVGDDERRVDGGLPRTKLKFAMPEGEISQYIDQGVFNGAVLTRYSVLAAHVTNNVNIFVKRVWLIGRAISVAPHLGAEFELRSPQDNPNHMSPSEFFIPPKFPWVVF